MKTRIAILGTRGIPARYGGFETFAEELATRLAVDDFAVTVYCEKQPKAAAAVYRGINLLYVYCPKLGPFTTILFDVFCLFHARKSFDVVYMLGYSASFFCFFPRIFGTEVWINMDGVEWKRSKWSLPGRTYIRVSAQFAMWTANRIIADSLAIKDVLVRTFKTVPNCAVIEYGANTVTSVARYDKLEKLGLKPNDYYLIVCRLEPENHIREVVEGFLQSASERILVIVGDHTSGTAYVKDLLAIHTGKKVKYLGAVYDRDLLEQIRLSAFAYFHGHSVGGTNPSLLEAMACRNAIIIHDNPYNSEVTGGAALRFTKSTDIPEICRQLEADTALRIELANGAIARVSEHYTWERITDEYKKILVHFKARRS